MPCRSATDPQAFFEGRWDVAGQALKRYRRVRCCFEGLNVMFPATPASRLSSMGFGMGLIERFAIQ